MKKYILLCLSVILTGCVPVLIGGALVTGYAVSNDAGIGNVKTEYRRLWDVSRDVLYEERAYIIESDETRGIIKAKIFDYNVVIRIRKITDQEQRLKVAARKYLLPQPKFAQSIFVKIIKRLM